MPVSFVKTHVQPRFLKDGVLTTGDPMTPERMQGPFGSSSDALRYVFFIYFHETPGYPATRT